MIKCQKARSITRKIRAALVEPGPVTSYPESVVVTHTVTIPGENVQEAAHTDHALQATSQSHVNINSCKSQQSKCRVACLDNKISRRFATHCFRVPLSDNCFFCAY